MVLEVGQIQKIKRDILDTYIVRPANAFGLGGFVFDVEGSIEINCESDITDHYIEDNTAIQDHAANKPVTIILKNYIGELVDIRTNKVNRAVQKVTQKLTEINGFRTALSSAQETLRTVIKSEKSLEGKIKDTTEAYSTLRNVLPGRTKQMQAFLYLEMLWRNKLFVTVETPYKFYNNMLIERIKPHQDEETKQMSDFTITLKQIRTSSVELTNFDFNQFQSITRTQREESVDKGKSQGKQVNKSLLLQFFNFAQEAFQ